MLVAVVQRRLAGGSFLVGVGTQSGAPDRALQRHAVAGRHVDHAGHLAQGGQVGTLQCVELRQAGIIIALRRVEPGLRNADQPCLLHAGGAIQALDALGDDEQRVADDRQGQRDLQHDQQHAGLVPSQRAQEGMHGHRGHSDFSCQAGCTRAARKVG